MRNINNVLLFFAAGIACSVESFASISRPNNKLHHLTLCESKDNTNKEKESSMGTWNPFSLLVLKLGFTEPAWTSSLNYKKAKGTYQCAYCRSPLFSSNAKYDSGSGWPSFWKTLANERVSLKKEWDGRIECRCANCGGHLGHVFPDGPTRGSLNQAELKTVPESDPKIGYSVQQDDGEDSEFSRMPRFCINGVALRFEEGGNNERETAQSASSDSA
ncbi:hypothetical protein ACHAXN_003880 [Cyclotella atomus]